MDFNYQFINQKTADPNTIHTPINPMEHLIIYLSIYLVNKLIIKNWWIKYLKKEFEQADVNGPFNHLSIYLSSQ